MYNIPIPTNHSMFSDTEIYKRQLLEVYQDGVIKNIVNLNELLSCYVNIDLRGHAYPIIMTMISTHDTYKLSRINDIKFYSNTDNDLTVCIEDKLVMRAIQHQVFVLENKIVIYRGYIIKEDVTTPNSILIYKMDNPCNNENRYIIQKGTSLNVNFCDWCIRALNYVDGLILEQK